MAFTVGMKVVCVRTVGIPPSPLNRAAKLPIGGIFTIREIDTRAFNLGFHSAPTVRLTEIQNITMESSVGVWEHGYHPLKFRPLVSRKTDISVFTKMLTSITLKEKT